VPFLVEDIEREPSLAALRPVILAEGIRSLAFIPLVNQGRLLGKFMLYGTTPRRLSSSELAFITTVASFVGFAAVRTQQEDAMAGAKDFSERLIQTANVLVVGLDRDGRVVIFNDTAEQATGFDRKEILGQRWLETGIPCDQCPTLQDMLLLAQGSGFSMRKVEMPMHTKTGEERIVSWRNSVYPAPAGKAAILCFGIDITDIRHSLEDLRGSEEKFSKIFHLSPDAIDLTRMSDGRSLDCNSSYAKLYGYAREEIIGHSTLPDDLGVWVRKEDRDRHMAELMVQGEVLEFEALLRRKDGSTFVGLISSSKLEIGGEHCNLSLTRDITEQKKASEALRASEEKFAKTFRLSPDAITISRIEDGVYLDVNQGFSDLTGYAAEEVIGQTSVGALNLWVNREDRERMVRALLDHGEVTGYEASFRRKNGSILIGLLSARMLDLDGNRCVLSITRNITERKQAEEALRESSQRLELALASGSLGIWDRDLGNSSETWNDRMYEIYGLDQSVSYAAFEPWAERILHPEDAPRILAAIRAAIDGKQPYDLTFRIIRPDGSVRHIKSNGIVLREAEGKAIRIIGINRDRTEQVEAEAERRRLQAEVLQAEKLESIGSLAGGVAHDINNVLTAILLSAEVLRGKWPDETPTARSLDVILHAGNRGRDLVRALTDFARKGLGETSSFDLNEVLRKEVELLRRTTLQKIRVVLDLDENLPLLLGTASELGSAIMNLSVNAVDAMSEGGTLTFRSRTTEDGQIELAVSDTGQGMTPEVVARAMEPFFTTKPVGKGTGLGLSRVYGTVRAHGGTVEIQSHPGLGTTIVLRLPTSPEANPEFLDSGKAQEEPGTSWRILLVDDEGIILETVPAMLESIGHAVETASLGEAALRRLEVRQDFDLVLLDHNMPGLTGVETLLRLRRKYPALPVILSTGFIDTGTEELLRNIPHVSILKKPYSIGEIRRTLAEISRENDKGPASKPRTQ
jgi:PAS domain S-box-containing protein